MFETDEKIVEIKNFHAKLRIVINWFFVIVVCIVGIYIMYYNIINNQDKWQSMEYTKRYFLPYAEAVTKIFTDNLSADTIPLWFTSNPEKNRIFTSAAFATAILALPAVVLYFIVDIIKDVFINIRIKQGQAKKKKLEKIEAQNELMQYEVIKYISVCVSLDWNANGSITEEAKNKLNAGLYQKLQNTLSKSLIKNDCRAKKAFVIKMNDFNHFDNMFTSLINILAKIKQQIEKNGDIKMIPTITVYAYVEDESFESIEKQHFKSMEFGFKNKAFSNNLFVKKYRFLKLDKYLGYSVGDYADFGNGNNMETIELNVIYDDLNERLSEIV